jgi:predicted AAA+ superfamily ATPase
MRAALFSPLKDGDPELGHLVETAVVSQYVHLPGEMYYARWKKGEVDLIGVDQQFKPDFVCEVKWSDKYPDEPGKLSNVIEFCLKNNIKKALVTTKTIEREIEYRNVTLVFMPASAVCFITGKAAIQGKIQAMKGLNNIDASVLVEGMELKEVSGKFSDNWER